MKRPLMRAQAKITTSKCQNRQDRSKSRTHRLSGLCLGDDVGVEFEDLDFSENQPYTPKNLVRHTGEDPMKWPDDLFTP